MNMFILELTFPSNIYFSFFFQMLGCKSRGFSFTRALLGIAADELHLCGDPAAVPLIQDVLKVTEDEVEVLEILFLNNHQGQLFIFLTGGWGLFMVVNAFL